MVEHLICNEGVGGSIPLRSTIEIMTKEKSLFKIPIASGEETDREIVTHNRGMLKRPMQRLLFNESIGGNAGTERVGKTDYPCAAANGYADRATGKIVTFGNVQDILPDVVKDKNEFTLRVAFDITSRRFFKIVSFLGVENFTERGKRNIQAAIDEYNK